MLRLVMIGITLMSLCGAQASAQDVQFFGAVSGSTQTGSCPNGNNVGSRFFARFRPADIGSNGPNSSLSLFGLGNAYSYATVGPFTTAVKTVESVQIGAGFGSQDPAAQVRFVSQYPRSTGGAVQTAISTSTGYIDVRVEIRNFDAQPGCTVQFYLVLARRFFP